MASDIFFTTNPAEFTKLEGLYISERNPPGFIRGADTSRVGVSGVTTRGPTSVELITTVGRFLEVYGGRDLGGGGTLVNEVWAMLINKPFGPFYVRRITAVAATAATLEAETLLDGTGVPVLRISASSTGAWGGTAAVNDGISARVEAATDGVATHFDLFVKYLGEEVTFQNLNINGATDDNLNEVVGDDIGRFITLTKIAAGRPSNFADITEANWVTQKNTDDSMSLGTTLSAYTTVAGSDGSVASADEIAAMQDLAAVEGPSIILQAGTAVDQNALNGEIVTQSAAVSDRSFLTWSGTFDQNAATEAANLVTDITTRSDRIFWCHNGPFTRDPDTSLLVQRPPHEWMASILSQNDVDVHPGVASTAKQTAGINKLGLQSISRADLIVLRDAGISTLEKLPGMFLFRSAVTTDLTKGKTEITRRRMADFLQLSAASRLRFFVKRKNTIEARAQLIGELTAFSQSLLDRGRVVEAFVIEQESVNTEAQRAQGVEKLLWRVKLIRHMLHLVLETEIGTAVVIEVQS